MDNTNFNASQFNEIATQISTTKSEIETSLNSIMTDFSSLSYIVASGDSGLSATCNNIQETYKKLSKKLSDNLFKIIEELNAYMNATIQNEETTSKNTENINIGLESAKSILDSIETL